MVVGIGNGDQKIPKNAPQRCCSICVSLHPLSVPWQCEQRPLSPANRCPLASTTLKPPAIRSTVHGGGEAAFSHGNKTTLNFWQACLTTSLLGSSYRLMRTLAPSSFVSSFCHL